MKNNQVAIRNEFDLSSWIKGISKNLTAYSDNADSKFLKTALIAIAESDALMKCMETAAGQLSVYNSLKFAAATGLSLNPQEGKAALIPYGGKVQYQMMKNGIIEMAMRSGKIEWLRSDVVRENDEYFPPSNPDEKVIYKPARKKRGGTDGYFAEVKLTDGSVHFKYMTVEDVEIHRDKYAANSNGPWKKSFDGMALKTVLKVLFRNTYISGEMNQAIGIDDSEENHDPEIINITHGVSAEKVETELKTEAKESPAKKEAEKKPVVDKSKSKGFDF